MLSISPYSICGWDAIDDIYYFLFAKSSYYRDPLASDMYLYLHMEMDTELCKAIHNLQP